jgi:predicted transcriptional regulator with HTH domain
MSFGRVKRKAYLMYLLAIRKEERYLHDLGRAVEPKPIEEIRAAFEAEHGSIYEEF